MEKTPEDILTQENLLGLAQEIMVSSDDIALTTFNDEMTISQVVRFFEKRGRSFTKTMIQNYVRVGVLPPPVDKRYYTKNHLILLTLIDNLKSIYSLEEIRSVFAPILRNPEIFEDDVISVDQMYENYIRLRQHALELWSKNLPERLRMINELVDPEVAEEDKGIVTSFTLVLNIMAQTIAMKDLTSKITEKYIKAEESVKE